MRKLLPPLPRKTKQEILLFYLCGPLCCGVPAAIVGYFYGFETTFYCTPVYAIIYVLGYWWYTGSL